MTPHAGREGAIRTHEGVPCHPISNPMSPSGFPRKISWRRGTFSSRKIAWIAFGPCRGPEQKLRGVVSFRKLLGAKPDQRVSEVMQTDLIKVPEKMDQEDLSRLFSTYRLGAIPVVDADGHMKGIVTLDDIVDVVREEATEDIQKIGGTAPISEPYLRISIVDMIKKRGGWLAALFIGETLTATAMGYFEAEIARAVVLEIGRAHV